MPTTQEFVVPKDQVQQVRDRAQARNATSIKEENSGEAIKLTISYPDDAKVLGAWDKETASGGVKYDAKGNVLKAS